MFIVAGVEAGLGEQLLVVPEDDLRNVLGKAVELAVAGEGADAGGADVGLGLGRDDAVDVAQHAGLDLLVEHAAAPAIDDVGRVVGLQQRRQLGLVGLVLEELQLEIGLRMEPLVLGDGLVHQGDHAGVGLQMQPVDGVLCRGGADRQRRQHRGKRESLHDVLPLTSDRAPAAHAKGGPALSPLHFRCTTA